MSKKILVVDDDAMNLRMAEFILQKEGYEVGKASSGWACIEFLRNEKADLLLLDVEMPEMNGFQTLAVLKEELEAQVPVVFLTASADDETVAQAKTLGAVGFVTKPFLPPVLLEAVAKAIDA